MRINNRVTKTDLRTRSQSGFSLIETIVFIVIVSVALAGVLAVMNFTTKHSADPLIRKQEIAIAESLLEEISLQNFTKKGSDFAGPYTQANRQYFDNISDYAAYPTPSAVYPIDTAVAMLNGYSVTSITVVPADLGPAASLITAASGASKLITVTVKGPDGSSVAISGYRTAYGN